MLSFLVSCSFNQQKDITGKAITELLNRFPQFPHGKANPLSYYKHIKTVTLSNKDTELQLWGTPDSVEEQQEILIIATRHNGYYAIPLFSNKFTKYWNFEFETNHLSKDSFNTTFNQEMVTALKILKIDKNKKICYEILDEFLIGVTKSRLINDQDSVIFNSVRVIQSREPQVKEESDICFLRQKRNFEVIFKDINKHLYNAYFDEKKQRIYQVINKSSRQSNDCLLEFKVYRQGCVSYFENLSM